MKYISSLIVAAVVSISALSAARVDDLTILGRLDPHGSVNHRVNLQQGNTTIEVFNGNAATKISCLYMDVDGSPVLEQKNVYHCLGNVKDKTVTIPWHLTVRVTNEEEKEIDYKIWVHETK
jgi:hypothetical protein